MNILERLLCRPGLREILSRILVQLDRMENHMSEQDTRTDQLNQSLAEVGQGLTDLAARIAGLDDDPNNITPEQIAAVKALGERVNGLAVAAPEIPTPDAPETPAEPSPEPTGPEV